MDIDERESNVDINEQQLMDIDDDNSDNDSIDDHANNDSRDKNTTSPPIQPIKKVSTLSRTELRKSIWYRFKPAYLQKYKWLRFDKENNTAYCSFPLCRM